MESGCRFSKKTKVQTNATNYRPNLQMLETELGGAHNSRVALFAAVLVEDLLKALLGAAADLRAVGALSETSEGELQVWWPKTHLGAVVQRKLQKCAKGGRDVLAGCPHAVVDGNEHVGQA